MGFSDSIGSWTTIDLQYSYNFMMGGTEGVITLGGKNITDEEAPRVYDAATIQSSTIRVVRCGTVELSLRSK